MQFTNGAAGPATLGLKLGQSGQFDAGAGTTLNISSAIDLNAKTLTAAGSGTQSYSGIISGGAGSIVMSGAGTLTLSGTANNTYSGKTTVNSGTLILNKNAGLNAISSTGATGVNAANTDVQIVGGAVQLNASNQIINSATIGMSGGTLRLNGVQEGTTVAAGVGALTLSANSVIDLSGTSLLHVAASGSQTWSGTLSIYNWTGTPVTGGGTEQLLFGTDDTSASLTSAQLAMITFYSDGGMTPLGTAGFAGLGNGEIVPVPEPTTWAAGILTVLAVGYSQRRRFVRAPARAVRS